MPHLGPLEIGIIVFLVLLVFGAGKLPEVFGDFGKAVREFRKSKAREESPAIKTEK